jgi:exodeoxyribonuclease V alpha subunit
MSLWTSPVALAPEIELLVRRWNLPAARIPEVSQLLEAHTEGGTACALSGAVAPDGTGWGAACHVAAERADTRPPTSDFSRSDPEQAKRVEGRPPSAVLCPRPPAAPIPRPLVLRQVAGRPYLQAWRFFQAEQTIARQLLSRAQCPAPRLLRPAQELLSDLGSGQVNEQQAKAITCALEHTLALITGGPGTGKTHAIARLLALLIAAEPDRTPIVHLGAPTGKAADRMKEAVEAAADQLPASVSGHTKLALKSVAAGASTLHRLLGFNPSTGRCRHHAREPLRSDVVIVDECSMVDTLLWQALLAALRPETRLVLVGDPHQLESVAAGDVLGSLVRFARENPSGGLTPLWVELSESQRFRHRPAIGALATAVVNLRADDAVELLAQHPAPKDGAVPAGGLSWLGDHGGRFAWSDLPVAVQSAITSVADARTAQDALAALARVRILTAHREHTLGASGLNEAIQRHLLLRGEVQRTPNQPIIINQNDPETRLTNGTVGIVMNVDGGRAAFFPGNSAEAPPRRVALGQLPDHSPAWAMTIHRSQGSEFEQVVVILPPKESPLATRELLYTAITRARQCVHVWGSEATVRAALEAKALRCTLLVPSLQCHSAISTAAMPCPVKGKR